MKRAKFLIKNAWIITAVCIAVFFSTALSVYSCAPPDSVSNLLTRDGTWKSTEELCSTAGNLEIYPYVTEVYKYETDGARLDIRYVKKPYTLDMEYGITENETAEHDITVECFVYSDIADKELVKKLWNISVQESETLTLTQTDAFNIAIDAALFNDIKKQYSRVPRYYTTFMRITVKSTSKVTVYDYSE